MMLSPNASTKIVAALAAVVLCLFVACTNSNKSERAFTNSVSTAPNAIDINRASESELTKLPGIGDTIAARIVEFREKNGPFRRPEQLLLVPGISEKKFREIRMLVKTDTSPHDE